MKKNVSIQFIRILAMIMIVLCHIFDSSNIAILQVLSQFLNVGVYIFLLVSGYLYGNKIIDNKKKFILNRIKKIMIPVWIFIIYISITHIIQGNFDWWNTLKYIIGIQYFAKGNVEGLSHLWFISIILLCYLLTLIFEKYKDKIKKHKYIILFSLLLAAICSSIFLRKLGQVLFYIFIYVYGYTIEEKEKHNIVYNLFLLIGSGAVRIIGKNYFDETIIYNVVIVSITQILIAISIFNIINILFKKAKQKKIIDKLDELSYYIYITHYQFTNGPINIYNILNINYIFESIIIIILTIFYSYILLIINKKLFIEKRPKNG